ncbi:MAG: NAD(P)-dependent alcohol dehydrogenase [Hyphomicrobiales bacterium]|nr:NAD(P)-dependent alcohol dehydrogenase [Hyphomicrobiales bacterium]
MRAWEVQDAWDIDHLMMVERDAPKAAAGEVVLRMRAASVNYRDLLMVQGLGGVRKLPLVPFSDGAGEVIAVGAGVSRAKIGDRVSPMFFQSWKDGPPDAAKRTKPLGGPLAGVLQEQMAVDADYVSASPKGWSFEEAATLPCAGLTAWRALMVEGGLKAGETVLVQGTGGVSIFALQFAKMRGARVIVTSSSDEKLARAKKLGADEIVNYRTTPDWAKAALDMTGGVGVDHVVEVGGAGTLNQSLEAAKVGGRILVIGVLSGFSQQIAMPVLFGKNLRMIGLSVGSREMFEQMVAAIDAAGMRPVIDRTFAFDQAPDALRCMKGASHFGKICISY